MVIAVSSIYVHNQTYLYSCKYGKVHSQRVYILWCQPIIDCFLYWRVAMLLVWDLLAINAIKCWVTPRFLLFLWHFEYSCKEKQTWNRNIMWKLYISGLYINDYYLCEMNEGSKWKSENDVYLLRSDCVGYGFETLYPFMERLASCFIFALWFEFEFCSLFPFLNIILEILATLKLERLK